MLKNNKLFSLSCLIVGSVLPCKNTDARIMPENSVSDFVQNTIRRNVVANTMADLQIIYNDLNIPIQNQPNQSQVVQYFPRIVYELNELVSQRFLYDTITLQSLQALTRINEFCVTQYLEYGVEIPENLLTSMRRNFAYYQIMKNENILFRAQIQPGVYQRALRRYLKLTEKYLISENLTIPSLNEAQINYAINALIEFLQNDIAEQDERKTKFFTEQLLEITFFDNKNYLNGFLQENNLQNLCSEKPFARPSDYSDIRVETQGRLEATGLLLPESQENINSLFFKRLLATLQEWHILDRDMLHRLAYWANYEPQEIANN